MGALHEVDSTRLPTEWVEMARHPAFAMAARLLAANMLDLCDEDAGLAEVFKDAGRYVAAMSAAYLHGLGGLTIALLKQICAGSGFLSPGRARAIVEFLVHLDFLREPADGNPMGAYVPTERFLSAWCRHLQAALAAAAAIEPTLATLVIRLADREVFQTFLGLQAARLHALTRDIEGFPALERAFLHPHAGSQILWFLTVTGENNALPRGDDVIRVPMAGLSSRFGVTHLHVRRLLRHAQTEGMITYHGHGRLAFTSAGAGLTHFHYAFQLSELVRCGRQLLAQASPSSRT